MVESIKELRKICVKKGIGFKSRMLSYMALYVTRPLLHTSITPVQIVIFWMVLKLIALLLLIPGKYLYALVGMFILEFAILLDNVDGQIVRYRKIYPKVGWYLDFLSHNIEFPLTFICLGIGIYNAFGQIEYVFLGFTIAVLGLMRETTYTGDVLNVVETVKTKKTPKNAVNGMFIQIKSHVKKWFELGEFVTIMFFGIIFYLWREVMWLYFIVISTNLVFKTFANYAAFKKYDKKFSKKRK